MDAMWSGKTVPMPPEDWHTTALSGIVSGNNSRSTVSDVA
jgi:hypothetical protein